jgi:Protein of unknown function (DUF3710)
VFRKRRRDSDSVTSEQVEETGTTSEDDAGVAEADLDAGVTAGGEPDLTPAEEASGLSSRPDGPWDATEVSDGDPERFDLGGLQLAIPDGAQVQLDVTPDNMVLPTVFLGEGAVQISAFAAPRRTGIWAEVRTEIAESLREAGGEVVEQPGPFGVELHGQVPVQLPDGSIALQPARFVGVDGPRWFLRGLFTGEGADQNAAGALEEAFRGTVVVRGSDAMAPRDPLPVTVPQEILEAAGAPEEEPPGIEPFQRGPEITEVR